MIKRSKFKYSGRQWFGQIPSDWQVVPLKHLLSKIYTGGTPITSNSEFWSDDENGIPWVAISDITKSNGLLLETAKRITEKGLKDKGLEILPINTLLLSIFASLGKTTRLGINATINQAILGLETKEDKLNIDFLEYLLADAERYIGYYSSLNTQENLNLTKIKNLILPLPSIDEQIQIVHYLDYQTSIIEDLISKKAILIELLKEQRLAIINEAITKGLDPTSKMKDSGLEWLAQIPESWKIAPLRYLTVKVGSGVTPKGGNDVYSEEGVIFIRSQNVHFDGLRLDDVVRIDYDTHEKMSNSKVLQNDVLLNITGASIGRCCIVHLKDEMNVNQHVCIIRPNKEINPDYLNLLLQSNIGQIQIKINTTGGNREGLTFEAIKDFLIPFPDYEEQLEIISSVNNLLDQFYDLEIKNLVLIEKLQKYRQSIISEAVTGKIDVRDWQPPVN